MPIISTVQQQLSEQHDDDDRLCRFPLLPYVRTTTTTIHPSTSPVASWAQTLAGLYKNYSDIDVANMGGKWTYNSLQASIQRRVSTGQSVTGNYTWSKSMDTLPYLDYRCGFLPAVLALHMRFPSTSQITSG